MNSQQVQSTAATTSYQQIKETLRNLYLNNSCQCLGELSGGKDNTMVVDLRKNASVKISPRVRL